MGADRDLLGRVLRSAGTVVVGSGFSKSCLVVVELCLAVVLGAAGYGLFSIVFSLIAVVATLAQSGFNFGIVQYLSIYQEAGDEDAERSCIRVSLLYVLAVSALAALGLFGGAAWLANTVFGKPELLPLLSLAAAILPFEGLNHCLSTIFRGLRQFSQHVLTFDLARNLVLLTTLPFAALGELDLIEVFYILAAGTATGTLLGFALLVKRVNLLRGFYCDGRVFCEIFSFSYVLFFWQVLQVSANRVLLLISGVVLATADVGVLAVAMRFVYLLGFPQTVFNLTAPVEFARFNYLRDYAALKRLYQMIALMLLIIAIIIVLPLSLNKGPVMSWFGTDYAPYDWVLGILLAVKALDVGTGPAGQVLVACRKRKSVLALSAFDMALQFLLVVPLMMVFGLAGAVYGHALRTIAFVSVRQVALFVILGIHSISRTLLVLAASGCVVYVLGNWVITLLPSLWWRGGITAAAMAIVGGIMVGTLRAHPLVREFLRGQRRVARYKD